ncbi:MAG: hypothetical protein A2W72_11875 [Burkholderiales bacterium RIFCSPLOWO2_12_67_14]|nr:MAG: hypothetical protein A3I64_23165 [Burkholderiales bacterium RIFCSPLOWO2_02_FULL_67_64]OGB37806.1 MAG: hypothetical protein A3E51_08620 [Burkholderiales bacterium RIFCSPHIGHO2_12_FULL_67_38]OGB49495.1 MAG: hypothetical protein A2W72_11875 [Burkholderiales bacterium RIFCSPLOWO2_12_67_14]OGB76557.1 MAG: hypothetical protein A3G82_10075 [Burkholderiales bacterium RIFCSPLOWO2_12_FULL_67_210]
MPVWAQTTGFAITDYVPVSKVRVAPSGDAPFEYTYRVVVRNRGAAADPVIGRVTSRLSDVVVVDADVALGAIAAGDSETSEDTFAVRAPAAFDRRLDPQPDGSLEPAAASQRHALNAVQNRTFNNQVFGWDIRVDTDAAVATMADETPQGFAVPAQPLPFAQGTQAPAAQALGEGPATHSATDQDTRANLNGPSGAEPGERSQTLNSADATTQGGADVAAPAQPDPPRQLPAVTVSIASPAPSQVLSADALPLLKVAFRSSVGIDKPNPGPPPGLRKPAFGAPSGPGGGSPTDLTPSLRRPPVVSLRSIDLATLRVTLDGQDVTALLGATANGFSHTLAQALPEGAHTLVVTVANTAGVVTTQSVDFKTESVPVIENQTPKDVFLPGSSQPVVFATYSDVGAGIDPTQVKLSFRGVDVTAQAEVLSDSIRYVVPQALPDGTHAVRLEVADKAGNRSSSEWQFGTAQPPEISDTLPKDTVLPAGSRPTISASYQDSRNGIDTSRVRLFVNSDDVTAQAQIGASGVSYTPAQPLAEGPYTVYLEVANTTNAATSAVWGFEVDAAKTYSVAITSPAGAQTVTSPTVTVTATASANRSHPTGLTLGGQEMQVVGTDPDGTVRYSGQVELIDGTNTLQVVASFADGQTRNASVEVAYDAPARITLLSPADKAVLGPIDPGANTPGGATDLTGKVERPVTITGQLSKPVVSVSINQQQATLGEGGLSFSFPRFFLREGTNMITAVATDALGRVVSTAITVSVDQTAPILRLEAPLDQAITSNNRIDIRGMVNDAVEGLIGAAEPTVSVLVNGQSASNRAAQVADRFFVIPDVPLQLGQNTLRITATDHVGNARSQELQVTRIAVGSDRLTPLSGNRQTAAANTQLPQPLVVVALNPAGEPLRGLPVQFDVMRGTGTISLTADTATKADGLSLARNLTVATDDFGRAQVWFTVGKQSGPGANEVRASHPALGEAVTFSANTQRGEPQRVNADHGKNQIAETNAQPLELLSLVVRDALDNPLPNVPVVFTIEEGDAVFPDVSGAPASSYPAGPNPGKAAQRIVMATDKNGITAVRPLLGHTPGTVRIRAQALKSGDANIGSIDNPADLIGDAAFLIQVKQAQDGPALFSGQIFDDKSQPLTGIKVSIGRTSLVSTTDALGKFELGNVPPGRIDLFIDGRTYNPTNDPSRAQYPSLHFEAYAVKGQNNQLTQPIYLPPLAVNPESAKIVGGDQDVILTIPGLEGFQMKVKANSVTFPDGSRTGLLIVSPVTADKLPMAPPGGGSFGLPAWTVQPAGTRFDPPIEVTMPNNRAYRAGDNQPVVQWDHDLSQYVPMGRATVSEDGAVLVTDSGSGLTKAGWGALCVYDKDKCGQNAPPKCNDCQSLDTGRDSCPYCYPDYAKDGAKCDGDVCKSCLNGSCAPDPEKDSVVVGSITGGVAFQKELGGWVKKLGIGLGVDIDLNVVGEGKVTGEHLCCARKGRSQPKPTLWFSGGGSFDISIPLIPALKKFAGLDATGLIDGIAPNLTASFFGKAVGSGNYDACKSEGNVTGNGEFGAQAVLAIGNAPTLIVVDKGPTGELRERQLTPLSGGVKAIFQTAFDNITEGRVTGAWRGAASFFMKSEVRFGGVVYELFNIDKPVWQPDGKINIPYSWD